MNSQYLVTWEEFKQKHPELAGKHDEAISAKVEKYEEIMFQFILGLLM